MASTWETSSFVGGGAAAAAPGLGVASTKRSISSTWMWFSPPVRMKSSCTSATTLRALFARVGDIQTPEPKLQKPSASGGETGTK